MSSNRFDPRKQFSKKLAGRAEWYWFLYMILMAVLCGYRPEAYIAAILLGTLVTAVMITSVLAYTDNSKYEKGLYTTNQVAKIKFNWKEAFSNQDSDEEEEGGDG